MTMKSESEQSDTTRTLLTRRRFLALAGAATCSLAAMYGYRKYAARDERDEPEVVNVDPPATLDSLELDIMEVKVSLVYSTKPVKGIPKRWVDQQGMDVLRYANFIQDQGLKNITPYHVLYPHFKKRGRISNSIPPRRLWPNIVPTLRVIDHIASQLNKKIKPFVSVYKSPKYNRSVRGRSRSQHLENRAVDVQFYGVGSRIVAKVARDFRKAGHFKGGVGCYNSFVRIDTRGYNVDW